ncbi:hypothetical protein ANABIO32_25300 [Rossellomorea marisflavi]|uniref:hypothetical protein n=1 Tax=Rossellomorea marisflavi TaxID=189381 RepID=UPI0025CB5C58|nr:hypothetical protein [Rossellomorea marisflavi]GLI84813.1 hypothetical protein ANABIO32_25300 [Rossellomorea marisflavi]
MSESTKLTLSEIKNMESPDRSMLTEKDYKHLNSVERTQAKLLIQQAQKAPNARNDLMNGNKNDTENTNVNESVNKDNNSNVNNKSTPSTDFGSLAKKLKKSSAAKRKPKFDETHSRDSVWIRNDLKKVLKDVCTEKGDKTRIINEALEDYFRKLASELDQ